MTKNLKKLVDFKITNDERYEKPIRYMRYQNIFEFLKVENILEMRLAYRF